jgi:hypothetical protein
MTTKTTIWNSVGWTVTGGVTYGNTSRSRKKLVKAMRPLAEKAANEVSMTAIGEEGTWDLFWETVNE